MKKILEAVVKKAVKQRLNELGAYHHWPVQRGLGAACLDCHGCCDGKYFAIETKRPGGKLTARQIIVMQQIEQAGGLVLVIDSIEAARVIEL